MTYAPPLQAVLGAEAVPLLDGMLIVGVGVILFAIIETEKQIRLAITRTEGPARTMAPARRQTSRIEESRTRTRRDDGTGN